MKNKRNRLQIISEILRANIIGSQEELLKKLSERQCEVTQATLSRDLKLMKVAKMPLSNGDYKYVLPSQNKPFPGATSSAFGHGAFVSLDFSGQFAVVKTKPGYASAIAWDIDNKLSDQVLATLAGDDTILVIPRDGVSRQEISDALQDAFSMK